MAIQLFKIRAAGGAQYLGIEAPDIQTLFKHFEVYLDKIPQDERYNIYYTASKCREHDPAKTDRRLLEQTVIPWDIDGIDNDKLDKYHAPILKAIGQELSDVIAVASGNGLQYLTAMNEPIVKREAFAELRPHYKLICEIINKNLEAAGLPGHADAAVWSPARLMRFPGTENRKEKKGVKKAELLKRLLSREHPVDLKRVSGIKFVPKTEYLTQKDLVHYPKPDYESILDECAFMRWMKENPKKQGHDQWYAALSITGNFQPRSIAVDKSHEISKEYPGYDPDETDKEMERACISSGPRTCENIATMFKGCVDCKHYQKIKSPIQIKSEKYIQTEDTGFHRVKQDGTPGKPVYEDLRLFLERQHPYMTAKENKIVYAWKENYWQIFYDIEINEFAQKHFDPEATGTKCNEFQKLVFRTNVGRQEWFSTPPTGLINLQNGIYDIAKNELLPHSKAYPFRYILPYSYDSNAKCPAFDQYLKDVTDNREDLQNLLMEYMGAVIGNVSPKQLEKALLLDGDGGNGKSVYTDVITELVGADNITSLTLTDLKSDQNRFSLDGKLVNIAEESPKRMASSEEFKNLVTGGRSMVKMVYKPPFSLENTAKMIFNCNGLPDVSDASYGFYSRLLVVPFDVKFRGTSRVNKNIRNEIFSELPGILNKAIEAYRRLIKNKFEFSESKTSLDRMDEYQEENVSVYRWFEDKVEFGGPDLEESLQDLYLDYTNYMEDGGTKPDTLVHFARKLNKKLPKESRTIRRRTETGQIKYKTNIKLISGGVEI